MWDVGNGRGMWRGVEGRVEKPPVNPQNLIVPLLQSEATFAVAYKPHANQTNSVTVPIDCDEGSSKANLAFNAGHSHTLDPDCQRQ
jgi:hypothetical protein